MLLDIIVSIRLDSKKQMMLLTKKITKLIIIMWLLYAAPLCAEDIRVSSFDQLREAIEKASPGDVIILVDGVYHATEDIIVNKKGTESKPLTIMAENIGAAEIAGKGGFNIVSPASHIIIKGFRFTHPASRARTGNGTTFCRWTQNVFETPGKGDYLTIAGSDHQIDHNVFQNKNSMGKFIAIRGEGSQIAERLWIHHNYFYNFENQGGANGAEALQFGLSGLSLSSSNSVVEYNLFEKCHGENELISVKASEVTLRYNTIRDCPAQFTLRHGNRCVVYGNYFFNTPGLRIFGDDHIIHSNYFENCSLAINIGNGGGEVADGDKLTSHDRPDRALIAFNTLVDNERNIVQTPRTNGLGATSITLAYNVIMNGGPAAEISGPMKDAVWNNNIIFHTRGAGDMPATGYKSFDPMLVRSKAGAFHLDKRSPLRNFAKEVFPEIGVDMDGQPRATEPDAGADEFSNARVVSKVLSSQDVGPSE